MQLSWPRGHTCARTAMVRALQSSELRSVHLLEELGQFSMAALPFEQHLLKCRRLGIQRHDYRMVPGLPVHIGSTCHTASGLPAVAAHIEVICLP